MARSVASALGALVAIVAAFQPAAAVAPAVAPAVYVALGDSYVAGPLVPLPTGDPVDCGRSDHNYPTLLANALAVAVFRDVSCGMADTTHFTSPQSGLYIGGTNPPQFNALGPDVTLVTVGIGGNDMGLGLAVVDCIRPARPPVGPPPCATAMTAGGVDQMSRAIAATAPKVDAALAAIHRGAPNARVVFVGYPHMFPDTGDGCWPYLPFLPEDVVYFRAKLVELNAMLAARTRAAGDTFVDTYTSSTGHDPCQPPGTAWVNGAVVVPLSYVMHPNELEMANVSRLVLAALRTQPIVATAPAPAPRPPAAVLPLTGGAPPPVLMLGLLCLAVAFAVRRRDVTTWGP